MVSSGYLPNASILRVSIIKTAFLYFLRWGFIPEQPCLWYCRLRNYHSSFSRQSGRNAWACIFGGPINSNNTISLLSPWNNKIYFTPYGLIPPGNVLFVSKNTAQRLLNEQKPAVAGNDTTCTELGPKFKKEYESEMKKEAPDFCSVKANKYWPLD